MDPPEIVILTTYDGVSDQNLVKIAIFLYQCIWDPFQHIIKPSYPV